jgi:DNA polymerase-3 subunit delta
MNYLDIFTDIKKGDISGVYLFYGDEEYVKEQALTQVIKSFFPKGMHEFNLHVIDTEAKDVKDIINACDTLPFMVSKKLVIVKDFPMTSSKKQSMQTDKLIDYLARVPSATCLIFFNRGQVDARVSIFTAIKKHGKIVEFSHLKPEDTQKWLTGALKKHSKRMDNASLKYMVHLVGNRIGDLNNELSKLISYTNDEDIIKSEDIDAIVVPNYEYSVFSLLDCIGRKDPGGSIVLLNKLISQGENPISLLAMTAKQLRTILFCCSLREEGLSDAQIFKKIVGHPFTVRKNIDQSRYFTTEKAIEGIKLCLETDYGIKSGKIRERAALELLLIRLLA